MAIQMERRVDMSIGDHGPDKVELALQLLAYAISSNLSVPDPVIDSLYAAQSDNATPEGAAKLEKAIRDLTEITYPTTIESIRATARGSSPTRFVIGLLVIS
jgi:hypothetical protein